MLDKSIWKVIKEINPPLGGNLPEVSVGVFLVVVPYQRVRDSLILPESPLLSPGKNPRGEC